jgi:hypothetical protein
LHVQSNRFKTVLIIHSVYFLFVLDNAINIDGGLAWEEVILIYIYIYIYIFSTVFCTDSPGSRDCYDNIHNSDNNDNGNADDEHD